MKTIIIFRHASTNVATEYQIDYDRTLTPRGIKDAEKFMIFNNNGATTVTIPPESTTNFVVGTEIQITKHGATGNTVVTRGSGVALYGSGLGNVDYTMSAQYSACKIKKIGSNTWQVFDKV